MKKKLLEKEKNFYSLFTKKEMFDNLQFKTCVVSSSSMNDTILYQPKRRGQNHLRFRPPFVISFFFDN
jgi:hypothetical protein